MSMPVKELGDALTLAFLQTVFTTTVVRALFPNVMMHRGDAMDIDADLAPGIYNTHPTSAGTFPSSGTFNYGKLIVYPKRNETRFQVGISEDGKMASRSYYGDKWNAWRMLT